MNTPAHGLRRLGWSGSALVLLAGLLLPVAPVSALEGTWELLTLPQEAGELVRSGSLATDATGALYVCDPAVGFIHRRGADGQWALLVGPENTPELISTYGPIAVNPSGVLYVYDLGTGRIVRRSPEGIWSTIADKGDGLGQTRSQVGSLAADSSDHLYVIDGSASAATARLRMRDAQGNWSIVIGEGSSAGYAPIGVTCDSADNLIVSEWEPSSGLSRIESRTPAGVWSTLDQNPQVDGQPVSPALITAGPQGELYAGNTAAFKRDSQGRWTHLITASAAVGTWSGMAADPFGNLFLSTGGQLGVNSASGVWSSLSGPGTRTGQTTGIRGSAVDAAGNLYVLESKGATSASYSLDRDGQIVGKTALRSDRRFMKRNAAGVWSDFAQPMEFLGNILDPDSIAAGQEGVLYLSMPSPRWVEVQQGPGAEWLGLGLYNAPEDMVWAPMYLAASGSGPLFVMEANVLDSAPRDATLVRIRSWAPSTGWTVVATPGTAVGQVGPVTSLGMVTISADPLGNLFVLESSSGRIQKRTPQGVWSLLPDLGKVSRLCGDSHGRLYYGQDDTHELWALDPSGAKSLVAPRGLGLGRTGSGAAGLFVDAQDRLYAAEYRRVQRFTPSATPALAGDVDGNGKIGIQDAVLCLRLVAGLLTPDAGMLSRADVAPKQANGTTGDGKVTIEDAIALLRLVAGLPSA